MPNPSQALSSFALFLALLLFTAVGHAQNPAPAAQTTATATTGGTATAKAPTDTSTATTTAVAAPAAGAGGAAPNGIVAPPAAGQNAPAATAPAAPANGVVTQFIMTMGAGGVPQSIPTIVTLSTAGSGGNAFGEPMSGSVGLGSLTGSVGAVKTASTGSGASGRLDSSGFGLLIMVLGGVGLRVWF